MKKIILLCSVLFLSGTAAFAQSFNLGLKAGMNFSKLNSDFASEENRLGYQVGVWSRIGAAGIYLQPEAYLGSKGSKFFDIEQEGSTVKASGKVNFTTFDVPVLLGTKIGFNKLNLRFMAGPVVSFVVDKNTDFQDLVSSATDFDDYKDQAWGIQAGTGVDIGGLAIDLRYEAGLTNISRSTQYKQKTNLFNLSLGFKLF